MFAALAYDRTSPHLVRSRSSLASEARRKVASRILMHVQQRSCEALLIDADGTLLATPHREAWEAAVHALREELHDDGRPPLSECEYQSRIAGRPRTAGAAYLAAAYFPARDPVATAARLASHKTEALAERLTGVLPLYADVLHVLLYARRRRLRTALVTSSKTAPGLVRRAVLGDGSSLESLFDLIVEPDTARPAKPDPDCYAYAARLLGVAPDRCFALEDCTAGEEAAVGAGICCLRIERGAVVSIRPRCGLVVRGAAQIARVELRREVPS